MRYILFVILFSLFSCKNMTKESYISNYESFVNKVELNYEKTIVKITISDIKNNLSDHKLIIIKVKY